MKSALKAYSININHGKYYISLFSTLLDSYDYSMLNWTWDGNKRTFTHLPEIFNIIINIATGNYDECNNWFGIDALCLKIIDMAISSNTIGDMTLRNIAGVFISYPCIRQYSNSLEKIPDVFINSNNRKKFINSVQDYFAYDLVDKLIGN